MNEYNNNNNFKYGRKRFSNNGERTRRQQMSNGTKKQFNRQTPTSFNQTKHENDVSTNKREITENVLTDVEPGSRVQIKTKQGEIINGVVYCSNPIPNPPLCILYQPSLPGYKNLHVVSLNQIMECHKIEGGNVNREVELNSFDQEAIERKLQKNLEERKNKMLTLNPNVDSKIQDLFDYLYKTMPQGQCEWRGNDIVLSSGCIKPPYKSLSSDDDLTQPANKYIIEQLNQFWKLNNDNNASDFLSSNTNRSLNANDNSYMTVNLSSMDENGIRQTEMIDDNKVYDGPNENNNEYNNILNEVNAEIPQTSNTSRYVDNQRSRFNNNFNNNRFSNSQRTPKNANQNTRHPNKGNTFKNRHNNSRFNQNNNTNDSNGDNGNNM